MKCKKSQDGAKAFYLDLLSLWFLRAPLDMKKSIFANTYSVAEAEVKSNPFSLNRGIISVWLVTCRRCWISLVLNSWSEGEGSWQTLAVLVTQMLLCCLPPWPATETTPNATQCFCQRKWVSHCLSESEEQPSRLCITRARKEKKC